MYTSSGALGGEAVRRTAVKADGRGRSPDEDAPSLTFTTEGCITGGGGGGGGGWFTPCGEGTGADP